MQNTQNLFDRFDKLDTAINKWLVANSITLLRFSMGLVFVGFGVLKFFNGISPIQSLATRTTTALTLACFPGTMQCFLSPPLNALSVFVF